MKGTISTAALDVLMIAPIILVEDMDVVPMEWEWDDRPRRRVYEQKQGSM